MTKSIILFGLIIVGQLCYAQPTIEGTYLPVRNTSIKQVWDTAALTMPVPTTGPNQVWDYSGAFSNIVDTFDLAVYEPAATPYFSDFPDATHSSFLTSPFELADSLWLYFIVDTNGIQNLGYYSDKSTVQGLIESSPTEFVMPMELDYLDTHMDTSRYEGFVTYQGIPAKFVRVMHKTMIAEGYGTLITPDGTYSDVMLGKEAIYEFDSIFVDLTGTGVYNLFSVMSSDWHRFHFLRNNTFASTHLMQINTNMAETVVRYGWYTLPVDFGSIEGTVYDTTGLPVTDGEMYLYREHSNFTKNDILATTVINFDGTYTFDSIPYGEYRIAARPDLSGIYNHAFTSYYGDTTDWVNCETVITSGDTSGVNINLLYAEPQSTPVTITGNVALNSLLKNNDPIPGIDIIVDKDPEDEPVIETTTDALGNFAFPYLDDGDYTIWVDIPGLNMAGTYNLTVAGGLVVSNLDFEVGSDSIYPSSMVSSIAPVQAHKGNVQVYPNPFTNNTTVNIELEEEAVICIEILDVSGKLIASLVQDQSAIGRKKFTIDQIKNAGLYFVKISINDRTEVIRIAKN